MRSSSICYDAPEQRRPPWALALALALVLAMPLAAARKKPPKQRPVEELINPLVGTELSTWLVGPISWMATEEEIQAFLRIAEEEAAAEFVESFWKARDPEPRFEANPRRETFEERLAEADKLYREGVVPGRRTDRGTIYVLYGEPEEVSFEVSDRPGEPPIEQWKYRGSAEPGLDGRKPQKLYRFFKPDEMTVFYRRTPLTGRDRFLLEQERRRRPPRR